MRVEKGSKVSVKPSSSQSVMNARNNSDEEYTGVFKSVNLTRLLLLSSQRTL